MTELEALRIAVIGNTVAIAFLAAAVILLILIGRRR